MRKNTQKTGWRGPREGWRGWRSARGKPQETNVCAGRMGGGESKEKIIKVATSI